MKAIIIVSLRPPHFNTMFLKSVSFGYHGTKKAEFFQLFSTQSE